MSVLLSFSEVTIDYSRLTLLTFEKCGPKARLNIILWCVGIIIFGILLTAYSPFEYLFHSLGYENSNGCPLLTFTGVPCPLCGMGRSLEALRSFDLNGSIYYNPSGIIFFPLSGMILLGLLTSAIFGYRFKPSAKIARLWYLFVILLALVWIINILWGHHLVT